MAKKDTVENEFRQFLQFIAILLMQDKEWRQPVTEDATRLVGRHTDMAGWQ